MPFTWDEAAAEAYQGGGVVVHVWRPAPALLVTRLRGHATLTALRHYTARAEREMSRGRLTVFHQWNEMTGYDPAARDELKRWGTSSTTTSSSAWCTWSTRRWSRC